MMCAKLSKKSDPKRILVISLTNIGDVVLTCPVIDILRNDFPQAKIDVVTGPKAVSLFAGNPGFCIKVFNKQSHLKERFAWFSDLAQAHYDCVVDLRQTMLPVFLMPKYATPILPVSLRAERSNLFKEIALSLKSASRNDIVGSHKRDAHLNRLRQVYEFNGLSPMRLAVVTIKEDEEFFEKQIIPSLQGKEFVVIAPGAAGADKRWKPEGFAVVADHLSVKYKVIFVGDANDVELIDNIKGQMRSSSLTLAGKINLRQLAFVLKKCSWAMTHDSGVMHLASYFNVPLVVLWGPTDINKYAPWTGKSVIVRCHEKCIRCLDPKSVVAHNCMSFIEIEEVIKATDKIQQ